MTLFNFSPRSWTCQFLTVHQDKVGGKSSSPENEVTLFCTKETRVCWKCRLWVNIVLYGLKSTGPRWMNSHVFSICICLHFRRRRSWINNFHFCIALSIWFSSNHLGENSAHRNTIRIINQLWIGDAGLPATCSVIMRECPIMWIRFYHTPL